MTRSRELAKILTDGNLTGTLDVAGIATANAGVKVDNITIDGTEIDLSSGDLTIDVANDIILDADHVIRFHKNTAAHGNIQLNSNDLTLASQITDADIKFVGASGGSSVLALTLDMSAAGTAIFNHNVGIGMTPNTNYSRELNIKGQSTNSRIKLSNTTTGSANTDGFDILTDGNGAYVWQRENDILVFATNNDEKVRVDASGRVMIGTTIEGYSSADDLTIATTGHTGITIRSSASHEGAIFFSDATSGAGEYAGYIQYVHSNNSLILASNGAERMRIDSNGRVGIGVVPSTIGTVSASLQVNQSFLINYSDNTTSLSHNAYFNGSQNVALTTDESSQYYQNSGNHIWRTAPSVSAGATVNYTERMRLHIGGIVSIPGGVELGSGLDATAANTLDDYEEGTWTPQIYAAGNITTSNITANYTKIGKFVSLQAQFKRGSSSGGGNTLQITGLPFAHGPGSGMPGNAWIDNVGTDLRTMLYIDNGATTVYFTKTGATSAYVSINEWENGRWIYLYLNYRTAS